MATFSERLEGWLAERLPTRQEIVLLAAVCAFPIYSWAIYRFLDRLTGWLFFLTTGEILAILAYVLLFAVAETAVVLLGLVVVQALLPRRLTRAHLISLATLAIFLISGLTILVQFNYEVARSGVSTRLGLLFGSYLFVALLAMVAYWRSRRLQSWLALFAERLTAFLYFYLPLSLIGLLVVVIRNVR